MNSISDTHLLEIKFSTQARLTAALSSLTLDELPFSLRKAQMVTDGFMLEIEVISCEDLTKILTHLTEKELMGTLIRAGKVLHSYQKEWYELKDLIDRISRLERADGYKVDPSGIQITPGSGTSDRIPIQLYRYDTTGTPPYPYPKEWTGTIPSWITDKYTSTSEKSPGSSRVSTLPFNVTESEGTGNCITVTSFDGVEDEEAPSTVYYV